MSDSRKIQATKNYRLFTRHEGENRQLDVKKHKKLVESMRLYGFLKCFPIVVYRDADGKLIVKDGQHRLAIAESLGLPVYWVEEAVDFDVALVNSTAKVWQLKDYAEKHIANGHKAYQEGLEFAAQHHIPLGSAFALLAGTVSFGNCESQFIDGTFKIRDRAWADSVAGVYVPMTALSPSLRNQRFLEACMRVCRVAEFDGRRLLQNAERCREKLVSYAALDAYLQMMEDVYNFGRKQLVGLKAAATMAMRDRNAKTRKPSAKSKAA